MRRSSIAVSSSSSARGHRGWWAFSGSFFVNHVHGSCQGQDVIEVDAVVFLYGPGMSQVQDLKSETLSGRAAAATRSVSK